MSDEGRRLTDHQCRRLAEIAERISRDAPERQRVANWQVLVPWDLINDIRAILAEGMAVYRADYRTRKVFFSAYRNGKES